MRIPLFFFLIFIAFSCNKENDSEVLKKFSIDDLPQTWELLSINTGLSGEIVMAEEVSVSEIYVFNPEGKFSKTFKDDFTEGNLSGTYELLTIENSEYLVLTYEAEIGGLSYCAKDSKEHMRISADAVSLFNGRCQAFDGPGMSYQRTK